MNSMADSIKWCAATHAGKIAVVDGERQLSYGRLYRRVNRLANTLLRLGLKEGDRCSILLNNCAEYMEIYLALASTGIAAVPLNFRFVGSEIKYVVNNSDSKALIMGKEFLPVVSEVRNQFENVTQGSYIVVGGDAPLDMLDYEQALAQASDRDVEANIDLDGCFFQGYTAGTTGFPKGCVNSNVKFVAHHKLCLAVFRVNINDVQLVPAPLFHEAPTLFALMQLFIGGTVVITQSPTPDEILRLIQQYKVTNTFMVPTMYSAILDFPQHNSYDVSSMRSLICAGAPLLSDTKFGIIEYFKGAGLNEFYGGTEVGVVTNLYPHEQHDRPRSVGKPIPGWEIKLLDEEGNEVPTGTEGEIYMKGPRLLKEYYKLPEVTRECILGDYFTLRDVGRFDEEGYLYIVDRKHDMIISGGENIFPIEIEEVIVQHSAVNQAVVIGVPDKKWGESLKAVVVLKADQEATEEEVKEFCRGKLAGYKIPKSVEFRTTLPMSSFGKILKRELREEFWKDTEQKV